MTTPEKPRSLVPSIVVQVRAYVDRFIISIGTPTGGVLLAAAGWTPTLGWAWYVTGSFLLAGAAISGAVVWYDLKRHRPEMHRLSMQNWDLSEKIAACEKARAEKDAELAAQLTGLRGELDHRSTELIRIVNVLLRNLAVETRLHRRDTRISVYRHDDSKFHLIGRVSNNVKWAGVGREAYSDNQGYISLVWSGEMDEKKITLPRDHAEWVATQVEKYHIPPAEAGALRMHSRVMLGCIIELDQYDVPYGVLCIESTVTAAIKPTTIHVVKDTNHFKLLRDVLTLSMRDLPGPDARRALMGTRRTR